jgi:pimeloyl-ACP methyl ester carboxylesterase
MPTVRSKDGTLIAYDKVGQGPPLILVDGALCYRASGPMRSLSARLAPHFTVYFYDRRGRGDSGDTPPWAIEREIEDLEALIAAAGGSAYVFGLSSGAALSLEAATRGLSIRKLALYEAPFVVDDAYPPMTDKYLPDLKALVAADRRGDAVKHFLRRVGVPGVFIALMRFMPAWKKLTAVAPTLVYDISIVEPNQKGRALTSGQWTIRMPALVVDGGKSPAWMRNGMRALAGVLPASTYKTLDGQTHMVKSQVLAPVLVEFFNA